MSTSIESVERLLDHPHSAETRSMAKVAALPSPFEWMFVITGALAFVLPILFWVGEQTLGGEDPIHWYFWMGALVSAPHVYATYVRLHRKIQDNSVSWWIGFPAYFGWVAILCYALYLGYYVEAMTAVNVWQTWHYLRQTYGVGCLYGQQSTMDDLDRKIRYWSYHLVFPWLIFGRWDMLHTIWRGVSSDAIIPVNFGPAVLYPLSLIAMAGFYLAIVGEIRLLVNNKANYRPVGLICYVTCMAIHWYGFMVPSHYQRGFFAVSIFHAIQYMALVWHFEHQTARTRGNRMALAVSPLVGFLLFWLMLFLVGHEFEQHFLPYIGSWSVHLSTILFAAISAHHYSVDTFIWRRSVGR
jgi:hypothetical protein